MVDISQRKTPYEHAFLFIAVLGLFLYRIAAWAVFNTGFSSSASSFDLSYVQGVARGAHVAAVIAVLVAGRRAKSGISVLPGSFIVCGAVMSIGAALVSFGLARDAVVIASIGAGIHGAASSILFLGWGVFYCRLPSRRSSLMIAAAFLLYGVFTMFARYALPEALVVVSFAAPLACGTCLAIVKGASREKVHTVTGVALVQNGSSIRNLPWGVIALIAGCCLISGTVDVIAPYSRSLDAPLFNLLWPALFLIVLVAAFVWIKLLKQPDAHGLWVLFAFLFFCCLIGFSSFYYIDQAVASEFVRATQELLMLFIWVFATEMISEYKLPALMSFGCVDLFFIQGEHIVVSAIRGLSGHFHVQMNATAAIVFAFMVAIALMAATLILLAKYSSFNRSEASASPSDDASPLDRRVSFLRETFMLSERECEIAGYLLRGYSLQKIADALNLSLDTVRYHLKNLYRKTDVHSKQDLIQLAESMGNET